ncbi:hypothetical protein ABH903_002325 [Brevibacterium epidermidis]|uniref:Citrate transporter-like domain-containing protein n=1 Tax=Brevibacterium epidermidis TaxID=1698 RepID=A0ABV4EL67_BREEP
MAVDDGDDRFVDRGQSAEHLIDALLVRDPVLTREPPELRNVRAGYEGPAPGSAEDEGTQVRIRVDPGGRLGELLVHLERHRIARLGTVGAPLFAALIICFIGAVVSAFASTTGILGALIPLAVPFLLTGSVGEIGLIIALAISSSVVDSSPFSTSGALVVANSPEDQRDRVFKQLMVWGFSMVVIAPIVTWLIFVVPGRG